jgi:hypothetical protein
LAENPSLADELLERAARCLHANYSADSVRKRVQRLACELIATNAPRTSERCGTCYERVTL